MFNYILCLMLISFDRDVNPMMSEISYNLQIHLIPLLAFTVPQSCHLEDPSEKRVSVATLPGQISHYAPAEVLMAYRRNDRFGIKSNGAASCYYKICWGTPAYHLIVINMYT